MIKMKYLLNDKPIPAGTEAMVCNVCRRIFCVPYGASLMVGTRRCEDCNDALLKAAAENKNDSPAELKKALGE